MKLCRAEGTWFFGGSSQGSWIVQNHPLFVYELEGEWFCRRLSFNNNPRYHAPVEKSEASTRKWIEKAGLEDTSFPTRSRLLDAIEQALWSEPPPWSAV